jgi:hypothetical protein
MLIFNRDVLDHEPGEDSPDGMASAAAPVLTTTPGPANADN